MNAFAAIANAWPCQGRDAEHTIPGRHVDRLPVGQQLAVAHGAVNRSGNTRATIVVSQLPGFFAPLVADRLRSSLTGGSVSCPALERQGMVTSAMQTWTPGRPSGIRPRDRARG